MQNVVILFSKLYFLGYEENEKNEMIGGFISQMVKIKKSACVLTKVENGSIVTKNTDYSCFF